MGVCLCKDKIEEENGVDNDPDIYTLIREVDRNNCTRVDQRVDELVKETLDVIASIVDDEPETPNSMLLLHDITDRPKGEYYESANCSKNEIKIVITGWLCLVRSLIRVIPTDHPMGASVITLLLGKSQNVLGTRLIYQLFSLSDDSPLPSKDSVIEVAEMIKLDTQSTSTPCERNLCVILGCLAEKLAGPCSIAILTDTTLSYLMNNITEDKPKDIKLFSLIALEKFAQTAENKSTIKRKLLSYPEHPLLKLEMHANDTDDFTLRQIGFCSKWSLDNYCE
jgi:RING finger and SPRY domain-containing protein 1